MGRHDERASFWVVRMHSDQLTSEDEAAFAAWLAEDPEHRVAYEGHVGTWRAIESLRGEGQALADLRPGHEMAPLDRRAWRVVAASIAAVAIMASAWAGFRWSQRAPAFETAVGEQRRVILSDTSAITLNTDTRIRTQISATERRIWLDRGQAHFVVAKDPARPFRVFAASKEVRALGTSFEVRRVGDQLRVTLEEGVVAVYRGSSRSLLRSETPDAPSAVVMKPGEQVVVAGSNEIQFAKVDVAKTSAWRFSQMILDAQPLSDAIAEINRYNPRQIILSDDTLHAIRVSGVFQTGSPEAFVEALTKSFPIEVAAENDRAIRLVSRPRREPISPIAH
jgi:transmembrane sensor